METRRHQSFSWMLLSRSKNLPYAHIILLFPKHHCYWVWRQENWINLNKAKQSLCYPICWRLFKMCFAKWKSPQWCFLGNELVTQVGLKSCVSFPGVQRSDHHCHLLWGTATHNGSGLVSFSSKCLYRCMHPHLGSLFVHSGFQNWNLKIIPCFPQKVSDQESHKIQMKTSLISSPPFFRDPTPPPQNFFLSPLYSPGN